MLVWAEQRWDKWLAQGQGYSKLRTCRISRGCQTMLDRPTSSPVPPDTGRSKISPLELSTRPRINEDKGGGCGGGGGGATKEDTKAKEVRGWFSDIQRDRNYAGYLDLDRPLIHVNDHYIEIHRYQLEPPVAVRPPTRRRRHRLAVDAKNTEIVEVEVKGIYNDDAAPTPSPTPDVRTVSGRSSDEENRRPSEDRHRALSQASGRRGPAPKEEAGAVAGGGTRPCQRRRRRRAGAATASSIVWPSGLLT